MSLLIYSIGGLALGLAWLMPGSIQSTVLGFVSVYCIIFAERVFKKYQYTGSFLYGAISHAIAFYWLQGTIKDFGGYSPATALFLQALFIVISALDFPFFIFIAQTLKLKILDKLCLRNFFAWITISLPSMRLFPWDYGHTLSGFTCFTQVADLGGVFLITAAMFVLMEGLVRFSLKEISFKQTWPFLSLLILICSYGLIRSSQFSNLEKNEIKVSLIQADIDILKKNNVQFLAANTKKYWKLSQQVYQDYRPDLIIWPESAITDFIPVNIQEVKDSPLLPYSPESSFLVGALSRNNFQQFNSAFGIRPDATVTSPYHKQILMPFGEYMPFANIYPELKKLNPNVAEFTAGKEPKVLELGKIKAAPLICYEDLLPAITREAVKKDANILVNLTNDAWFGKTLAASQHNQIASFRAIESRRYLLRSTNSGLTSIISPLGETIATLPAFQSGTLNDKVHLLEGKTIYNYTGDIFWWLVFVFSFFTCFAQCFVRKYEYGN